MTPNKLETGGPAYPTKVSLNRDTGELIPHQFGNDDFVVPGMSLRTYAAITLGVPQSEHDWINDMIRESQRQELAKAAMQGLCADGWHEFGNEKLVPAHAFLLADAMLAEQEKDRG